MLKLHSAKEVFEEVGTELKRTRVEDLAKTLGCYLTDVEQDDSDPAKKDENLRKKLEENQLMGQKRLDEVFIFLHKFDAFWLQRKLIGCFRLSKNT